MNEPFARALLSDQACLPTGLRDDGVIDVAKRFCVYRNNVMSSLIDALATSFVVTQQLVGETFFRAMASIFVREYPPTSPILVYYGAQFPHFIRHFPPAASLPYLADMAQLEYDYIGSFHSRDQQPLSVEALSVLLDDEEQLLRSKWVLAPAVRVLNSEFAIASLWQAHQTTIQSLADLKIDVSESVLMTRPDFAVNVHLIDAGAAEFIHNVGQAQPLEQALMTQVEFDLTALLHLLIQQKAIIAVIPAN